jgi:hypothetical protein
MNTTVKTLVALPAGYDGFGCQVSLLRYRVEIIFRIHEKVDVDGELMDRIHKIFQDEQDLSCESWKIL